MATTLPSDDVPIASINVTEAPYNAKKDGSVDATSAFQSAINRAANGGGAVVFVPAGSYRFNGNLNIPESVVLRGEWTNPETGNAVGGTILMPYAGKGSEIGAPFISIQRGAGIKNLSIWYSEQSASSVSPYPWSIHCHPDGDAGSGNNTSVINVTLVNSYNGIKVGPNWNELHYLRNIYGTPLKQGIWLSQTTDIGRIENVHFEPKYWSASGLSGAPSESSILNWLQNNSTIGIIMGRSDWEYIYDVSFVGYQTGMQIIKYSDFGPNGVIYGLRIEKSNIGIDLVDVNPIGWAISNSIIKVEGSNSACVRAGDAFNSVIQFNTCLFGGDPKTAVKFSGYSQGRLSFQNCSFENWGQTEDTPGIDCIRGSVSLLGNTFKLDKLHLRLGANVTNSQILDNVFPTKLKIDNQSTGEVIVSQEPLNSIKQNVPSHPYAAEPRPTKDILYNVTEYGAVADGATDNTVAFQSALDKASQNGGGTVYIPSGMYRISTHIVVPTGVELRGIWDVPHHTTSRGSVLLAYEGKGAADGTPFISLEKGSGVRGLTIWYPEQNTQGFFPYPWSIQTLGENCWIKDVTMGNTYQGADLASHPSTGHVVSYLAGCPLKTGISVSKSTGDGWIENVMFNPHFWQRSLGYPQVAVPDINTIISKQQSQLDAFIIGTATKEHILGTFVFAAKRGMFLASDEGTSNIDIFLHGTDAGANGIFMESKAGSKINFINSQLVLLGNAQNGIITTVPGFGADVSFYNTISWGGAGPTTNLTGNGNVLLQQLHSLNGPFNISNGSTRLESIAISSTPNPQFGVSVGIGKLKVFGSYSGNGFIMHNYANNRSIVEADYYYNQNNKGTKLMSGWENNDLLTSWDNTFFGNKDFVITDNNAFQCEPVGTVNAHAGLSVLKIVGTKINGSTPYFKVFNSKISVSASSILSYWLRPQDEPGKTGHFDLLFTDGTRLTELSPIAEDDLSLKSARGTIGQWTEIKCQIGKYAAGKIIQSVLIGAEMATANQYSFLVDDLLIGDPLVVGIISDEVSSSEKSELFLYSNYPNPFSANTTIDYEISKSGFVTITVYDVLGKKIASLVDKQHQSVGRYNANWIPNDFKAGIYFYKVELLTDSRRKIVVNRKMILAK